MRCKNCHAEVNLQEICPVCGEKLEEDDYSICPNCHNYTEEKIKCPYCNLVQLITSDEFVEAYSKGKTEEEKKEIKSWSNFEKAFMKFSIFFIGMILLLIILNLR